MTDSIDRIRAPQHAVAWVPETGYLYEPSDTAIDSTMHANRVYCSPECRDWMAQTAGVARAARG